MPINGRIKIKDDHSVLILGAGGSFMDYEIVINNLVIDPIISHQLEFIEAGQVIGIGMESSCTPNYIHVAVRLKSSERGDKNRKYVDPTPFLNFLIPNPKWTEYCRDYEFLKLGKLSDLGNLGTGLKDLFLQKVRENFNLDLTREKLKQKIEEILDKFPDTEPDDHFQVQPEFNFEKPGTKIYFNFPSFDKVFSGFTQLFEDGDG